MSPQSTPHTPPNSTSPSASTSPSSHRLLGFSSPHAAAFSPTTIDSSPTTTSHHSSDARDEDEESDVEIYLSALTINNTSTDDPISISLGSIDNSFVNDERSVPAASDVSLALQSSIASQSSRPQLPSAPLQQTIPLPPVSRLSPDPHDANTLVSSNNQQLALSSSPPGHPAQTVSTLHQAPADAETNASTATLESLKTSNVYINGLPPHFPEDQLYALAAPYGPIRSVRTFTRHVKDNESGYGFVLFETVEAAEKCIQSLRRYRNLHPTFSKTVHKIPGTYSHSQLDIHPDDLHSASESVSSIAPGWDQESPKTHTELGDEASFKAKMESLHDPTSTNLYMEGLPLSIDEPTLIALVSPHKISSSRFFQTRLSNPPRIIAFVRFETRSGAEEIIERLHGRMVRGWNDTGSRISVRFADTAEQRELRRSERSTKEDEQSPARLTIAQASLLNLRGQDFKSKPSPLPLPSGNSSLPPPPLTSSLPSAPIILDHRGLSPHPQSRSPYPYEYMGASPVHSQVQVHTPPFAVDYSLAASRAAASLASLSRTQTPVHLHGSPYHVHSNLPGSMQTNEVRLPPPMDPAMSALLDSLRGGGVPFHPTNTANPVLGSAAGYGGIGVGYNDVGHSPVHHALGLGNPPFNANLLATNRAQTDLSAFDGVYGQSRATSARSGYTATEEFIMRAHAEAQQQQQLQHDLRQEQLRLRQEQLVKQLPHDHQQYQRRRPPPLELGQQQRRRTDSDASIGGIGVGVRGYRAQAAAITVPGSGAAYAAQHRNLHAHHDGSAYSMNEDEFHASSQGDFRQFHQSQQAEAVENDRTPGAGVKHPHNHRIHPAHVNNRLSRDHTIQQQHQHIRQQSVHQQQYNPSQQQQQSQSQSQAQQQPQSPNLFSQASSPNPNLHQHNYQQAHLRSMTLPQRRPPSASAQRHYQHNSMSVTVSGSGASMHQQLSSSKMTTNTQTKYTNKNCGSVMNKNVPGSTNNDGHNIGTCADTIDVYDGSSSPTADSNDLHFDASSKVQQHHRLQNHFDSSSRASLYHHHHASQQQQQHQNGYDTELHHHHQHNHNSTSPSLNELASPALTNVSSSLEVISPALTYSVHSPASTLSPATPFFGSFANANGGQNGHHGVGEQKKVQEAAVGVVGMGVSGVGDVNVDLRAGSL